MKKYLLYILNFAIVVAMGSCSGNDDVVDDGGGGTTPETWTVITGTPTEITESSAKIPVEVKGKNLIARGVCYSIAPNPTIEGPKTDDGTTFGSITSTITSLTSGTTYYVRGYATNSKGTIYGEEKQFKTLGKSEPETGIKIATLPVKDITETTAMSGGNITDAGNSPLIGKGICWSLTENPTIDNFKTTDGAETGIYNSKMTELSGGDTYYVRSYATNNKGTSYGQQIKFKTSGKSEPETGIKIATLPVKEITKTTAVSGGNITDDGGSPLIEKGICWSLSENPTIDDFKTTDGAEIGIYNSKMTGLSEGVTYYVRSYAINETGVGYGNIQSFVTLIDGPIIIFEDKKFEAYCLRKFDRNNNGVISIDEVANITELIIFSRNISSLKEIQYFTSLTTLSCYDNQLTSLDVSRCTSLTTLNCANNQLTSLNVSGCTSLTTLNCSNQFLIYNYNNQLTSLDLSGCTSLTTLNCYGNRLTSLNVSGCAKLTSLDCSSNPLTSLDVSRCTSLTGLKCSFTQLTSLNASGCTSLTTLDCRYNPLTSLNASGCTKLTSLDCSSTQLTSLDLSGCTSLTELNCSSNQLTSLNMSRCTSLTTLNCSSNQLTSLDVSRCTILRELYCSYNPNLQSLYLRYGQNYDTISTDSFTQIIYK